MTLFERYVAPYLKKYQKAMAITILFGVLAVLTSAMLTFTAGFLISKASERPETIMLLTIPIVLTRTFGLSRAVTHYVERLAGHNAVLKILADMRVKLYQMLEPQALMIRSRFQTGDLLGTLADDIEHLQDVYIRTIFPTVVGLCLFVYVTIMFALFDWVFALWIALCLSVVVFVYPLYSLYKLKQHQVKAKEERGHLYRTATDAIFGVSDWMISGRKQEFIESFMQNSREHHETEQGLSFWNQSRSFQLQVFSGIVLVTVAIWAGHAVEQGQMAAAYIAAFTLVTLPVLEGMIPLSHAVERIPAYEASLNRIEDIRKFAPTEELQVEAPVANEANIVMKDVAYQYEGSDELALQQISLRIPQGKKVALLGKSGAGKSTLLQLLQGSIEPTVGDVTINGAAPIQYGEDIHHMVGVLNQKPYLFATTVENNIRLGNQDATTEQIEDVIRQVRLDDYIHDLPNGLQTQMEETGQRFSGGERQRIALARILLQDTPVVILDEPTIGLDPITESELVDTILTTLQDKTIIWITHHLTGIEQMDEVIFLDKGQISIQGPHAELMKTNERYQQLYTLDLGE